MLPNNEKAKETHQNKMNFTKRYKDFPIQSFKMVMGMRYTKSLLGGLSSVIVATPLHKIRIFNLAKSLASKVTVKELQCLMLQG